MTPEEARDRLAAATIAAPLLECAATLRQAGHAAVLVGGAVRDALLGRSHDDWDLATSATPDEVQALFRRTIPTGVAHGTVTVMVGEGDERTGVEVTTFRGEGAYLDGRRPSEVHFHRELVRDLERRDFTVNAFAWDPGSQTFTDAFAGLADLREQRIRAVGDPARRFAEDGLRTMRAVRFCATLGFSLDEATEAAIGPALGVLAKVARERVWVELSKLLAAPACSGGVRAMIATGIWQQLFPTTPAETAIDPVDEVPPDVSLRLAALLRWGERDTALGAVDTLRPSRAERKRVLDALSPEAKCLSTEDDVVALRRAASALGGVTAPEALRVWGASSDQRERVEQALDGAVLNPRQLAVAGKDLIRSGIVDAGPQVGVVLRELFDWVLEDPTRNQAEVLLGRARASVGRGRE